MTQSRRHLTRKVEANDRATAASVDNLFHDKRIDGRTIEGRRFIELRATLADALTSKQGIDPTLAQVELIRRAAGLGVFCELVERAMTNDKVSSPEWAQTYCRVANSFNRVLGMLKLDEPPKPDNDPIQSLGDYLKQRASSRDTTSEFPELE